MDAVALSQPMRAALAATQGGPQIAALKSAAQAERAVAALLEQAVAATKAATHAGQGRIVDRMA